MKKLLILLPLIAIPWLLLADETPTDIEAARKKEQAAKTSDEDDPFGAGGYGYNALKKSGEWRKNAKITSTQIRLEWFETGTKETIALLDDWKPAADASAIRKSLLTLKKTTVKESLLTQLDVGEKSTTETILEMIYPTEYEPPEGLPPSELPLKEKTSKQNETATKLAKILSAATATAFETRNIGVTTSFALEPTHTSDVMFDLSFVSENVSFIKMIDYGQKGVVIEMPLFNTIRTSQTLRLKLGQWRLASIQPAVDPETGTPVSTRRLVLFIRLDVLGW